MPSPPDIAAQSLRFLPPELRALAPVVGGRAASFARAAQACEDLADAGRLGQASGAWLDLLAASFGCERGTDEGDDALRARARHPDDALTPAAILAAVARVLARYGSGGAVLIEHHQARVFAGQAFADHAELFDAHLGFTLRVPALGELPTGPTFADQAHADQNAWAGSGDAPHPAYAEIAAAVEPIRAAGVRWWLLVG